MQEAGQHGSANLCLAALASDDGNMQQLIAHPRRPRTWIPRLYRGFLENVRSSP